jgi:hypothetical protein
MFDAMLAPRTDYQVVVRIVPRVAIGMMDKFVAMELDPTANFN